ncbi:MAG: response regulator [Myxococcaceae bacterium]|nr:response regulator [Myxococcaceae bacterium]
MPLVLIVEDEKDLAALLELNLSQAGFEARVTHSGAEGLRLAAEVTPELVLLDLNLPDLSGLDVCRQLRVSTATRSIPVVMLTARSDERDRVSGFESGADDYVVKPFSIRELVLRLRAVLRRTSAEDESRPPVVAGIIRLEPAMHRCFIGGEEVHLTQLEFRLLHHLSSRVDRVQTREVLLEQVWGLSTALETRTVDTHVMRLRDKLGPARDYLQTVRGVGYRLVIPEEAARAAR